MTLGTFWALLTGGAITVAGGFIESWWSDRRATAKDAEKAATAKRVEQRDQLVELIDAGRQWASNLSAVMAGITANPTLTLTTKQWAAMDGLSIAYRRALLTAQLVVDDATLRPKIAELVVHLNGLSDVTSPLVIGALAGTQTRAQGEAVLNYVSRAESLLDGPVTAAQKMLARDG